MVFRCSTTFQAIVRSAFHLRIQRHREDGLTPRDAGAQGGEVDYGLRDVNRKMGKPIGKPWKIDYITVYTLKNMKISHLCTVYLGYYP